MHGTTEPGGGLEAGRARWQAWFLGLGLRRALLLVILVTWAASLAVTLAVLNLAGKGSALVGMLIASLCALGIGAPAAYLVLRLAFELQASREQIRALASMDDLTGTYNRRHFMQRAEEELHRARRYGTPLSLVLLDADHFKRVNDTHGHLCGDLILQRIAAACRSTLRATDLLARFGGEELILLLPQTDLAGALAIAERIREQVAAVEVEWAGGQVEATVSLGVATLQRATPSLDALIHDADLALYDAKRTGRNRVCGVRAAAGGGAGGDGPGEGAVQSAVGC